MKKRLLFMALVLGLTACNGTTKITPEENIDIKDYQTSVTGDLGDFHLLTPGNATIVENATEFTWEACENATKYTLEVSSSEFFISDLDSVDYYSAKNITATSFKINAEYKYRDVNYYWRVTAYNDAHSKQCELINAFYIKAMEVEEVKFDLGEADDWTLHPVGSYADISMDNSNFFGNDEKSLRLQFKKEDTCQGKPESDGWIIVNRTIERSIYGTDALFFNMYYSGHEASVYIRLVDRDNEYWVCQALISNNAKQSIILKFEDFVQRKGDVPVANEHFDYERIKYLEIVFERTFGDGIFMLSGMKAIKFDNYRNYFIEQLDFDEFVNEGDVSFENYTYGYTHNGTEATLNYYNTATEDHAKINGYGFMKVNINRYFITGDAVRVKVKYTGSSGSNVIIRIYEEDTDRWFYRIPYKNLSAEYTELIIPFAAFAGSSITGDGRRQFYYILNVQFGCEGQYGEGSISFKDFEVVKMDQVSPKIPRVIGSDGVIENFDNYVFNAELFHKWNHTEVNKDEYMSINTVNKVGGNSNPACGQFEYKSDMMEAVYDLPITTEGTFDGFSIWMKDDSMKPGDSKVDHVTNWSPKTRILIKLTTKEIYQYILDPLPRIWNEYNIKFEDFVLANEDELRVPPNPITPDTIVNVGFAFSYYYYNASGMAMPMYSQNNPVYVDNIKFTNNTVTGIVQREKIVTMNGNVAEFDDFEGYVTSEDVFDSWSYAKSYDYQLITLSNDVSNEGGSHSMAAQFKTYNESPSYAMAPAIDSAVKAKAVQFSLKCDVAATVFFNIYLKIGSSTQQYRVQINGAPAEWTEYTIGFDNFTVVAGTSTRKLISSDMTLIQRVTFGMVHYSGESNQLHNLLIDNLRFDFSKSYAVNETRTID